MGIFHFIVTLEWALTQRMKNLICLPFLLQATFGFEGNEIEYQTSFDSQYGLDQSASPSSYYDPASAWSSSDTDTVGVTEKQDELDMATILPIAVFGGLGLGALAYWDSITRYTNLCNKLKEVTAIARGTASDGTTAAALTDAGSNVSGETNLNTVVNSNRVFINSLATIADLAC